MKLAWALRCILLIGALCYFNLLIYQHYLSQSFPNGPLAIQPMGYDSVRALAGTSQSSNVFILSLPRSGSTFLGRLFLENPGFTYLFEATRSVVEVWKDDLCGEQIGPEEERILLDLFNCDFRAIQSHTNSMSLALKNPQLQWKWIAGRGSHVDRCFPKQDETLEEKKEREKTFVAIKEISMWGPRLHSLYTILMGKLTVIWLVRDVRGWVSSWLEKGSEGRFYDAWAYSKTDFMQKYSGCQFLPSDQYDFALLTDLLRDTTKPAHKRMAALWAIDTLLNIEKMQEILSNVILIKYEELSYNPMQVTTQLLENLGQKMPDQVAKFISESTKKEDENRYSTFRNSTKMAEIWRTRLTNQEIHEIEEIAGFLFPFFGYEKVT